MRANLRQKVLPSARIVRSNAPGVELQFARRSASVGETRMCAALPSELNGGAQSMEVDLFGNSARERSGGFAVEGQAQLKENIMQSHEPEAYRTPSHVRSSGRVDRIEIEVDDPVELAYRQLDGLRELLEVESPIGDVACEIDRPQVAHRAFGVRGDFENLGAE